LRVLNKTGKRKVWGFEDWPLGGEAKVFENRMDFTLEASLLNDKGRAIGAGRGVFTSEIKKEETAVYGSGDGKIITFTVKAGDISDKMTVKITKVNGRDAAAAGNSGYMKIAADSTSYPPPAKEYKIGDTGPAGGIIFYVREGSVPGAWRYLEAAPQDFPDGCMGIVWN